MRLIPAMDCFSVSHWARMASFRERSSASSLSMWARRFLEPLSSSFVRACFSISSCMILRPASSSSAGRLSISIRILLAASSIRSIALSGRKRSVI